MSTPLTHRLPVVAALAVALLAPAVYGDDWGDDWPQWLGPTRDGVWHEEGVVETIPAAGLPVVWRVPVKGGYSGPAVVGGRVYLTDYEQTGGELANNPNGRNELTGRERVLCFDAADGRLLYKDSAGSIQGFPAGDGVNKIVAIAQTAYDAITPDPSTLYVIT